MFLFTSIMQEMTRMTYGEIDRVYQSCKPHKTSKVTITGLTDALTNLYEINDCHRQAVENVVKRFMLKRQTFVAKKSKPTMEDYSEVFLDVSIFQS